MEINADIGTQFFPKDIKIIANIRFRSTRLVDVLFKGDFDFLIYQIAESWERGSRSQILTSLFCELMKTNNPLRKRLSLEWRD